MANYVQLTNLSTTAGDTLSAVSDLGLRTDAGSAIYGNVNRVVVISAVINNGGDIIADSKGMVSGSGDMELTNHGRITSGSTAVDLSNASDNGNTAAQDATFIQPDATQWLLTSFDSAIVEVINFSNSAAIRASDFIFV